MENVNVKNFVRKSAVIEKTQREISDTFIFRQIMNNIDLGLSGSKYLT